MLLPTGSLHAAFKYISMCTLPNGQTLFIGSSGTGAPSDEKPKK